MEYLFEIILELLFEGSIEISKSKKIPKYIRYPLIAIIASFFLAIIGLILFVGIISLKENILLGIFFILIGLFMFIASIIKFKNMYLTKVEEDL